MVYYNQSCNFLFILLICNYLWISNQSRVVIKQVNVLFRHGDRTPIVEYPNIPFTSDHYFPAGRGELTNRGKKRAFEFGEMLRDKYDDFLGSTYRPKDIEVLSTNLDRTKMSLQLVLAGLYPPDSHQKWHPNLNWQPIPIHYRPIEEDYLFEPKHQCKLFRDEYDEVWKSPELRQKKIYYDDLAKNLSVLVGKTLNHVDKLAGLYADLECLEKIGFKLPNWIYDYFPNGSLSEVITTVLRKFIRQFLENINDTTNSLPDVENNPKMYLYSGHDLNIAAVLAALNSTESILSKFTSAVIVELFHIDNSYYVKILYYLGIPPITKELKISNCGNPCPLEEFKKLMEHLLPTNEEFKCV